MVAKLTKPAIFDLPFNRITFERLGTSVKIIFWNGSNPSLTINESLAISEVLSLDAVEGKIKGTLT